MTYKGIIKNSKIETTIPLTLPEGTEVEITPLVPKKHGDTDPVCGSWLDDRTPENSINEIRSARYTKPRDL